MGRGGAKGKKGGKKETSAKKTAKTLGTTESKVNQARKVEKDADPATKQAVKDGKKTIGQAYKETKKKEKAAP